MCLTSLAESNKNDLKITNFDLELHEAICPAKYIFFAQFELKLD